MPERGGKVECRVASRRTIANLIALINSNQTRPNQTKLKRNETETNQTEASRVELQQLWRGCKEGEGRQREGESLAL